MAICHYQCVKQHVLVQKLLNRQINHTAYSNTSQFVKKKHYYIRPWGDSILIDSLQLFFVERPSSPKDDINIEAKSQLPGTQQPTQLGMLLALSTL